ncbi:MAG TPA: glycosyltransferase family 4 protein [Pyrinomonadaceae bacterium]|jgi:glycosyltransferase involved in cell wall biosynthesis
MRLIILNQFFYPDHSATSQLMTELAESLAERGVGVTALAGRGRYNGGERLSPYEDYKGVRVERARATSYGKGNVLGRLSDYLSFYVGATWKLSRMPHHDIVMALTTPPLIGLVALVIGHMRGMRVVALVQDVYPDIAVALGTLGKRSPATLFLDYLSRLILQRADRIIVLGECMRERVAAKVSGDALENIDVIHNWADGAAIKPLGTEANPFIAEHDLQGRFVVLFSGNLGRVNEFETTLGAARSLRDRGDIIFLFIGDGTKAVEIERYARANALDNIRMLPYQSRGMLPFSLGAGHASLVTLADGLAGLSVPSKTYAILAAGRPVLFVGDRRSDVARMVRENGCGEVVAAGDCERLAFVIEDWSADREKVEAMGRRARALFEASFDRPRAVNAYLEAFAKCLSDSPQHAEEPPRVGLPLGERTKP